MNTDHQKRILRRPKPTGTVGGDEPASSSLPWRPAGIEKDRALTSTSVAKESKVIKRAPKKVPQSTQRPSRILRSTAETVSNVNYISTQDLRRAYPISSARTTAAPVRERGATRAMSAGRTRTTQAAVEASSPPPRRSMSAIRDRPAGPSALVPPTAPPKKTMVSLRSSADLKRKATEEIGPLDLSLVIQGQSVPLPPPVAFYPHVKRASLGGSNTVKKKPANNPSSFSSRQQSARSSRSSQEWTGYSRMMPASTHDYEVAPRPKASIVKTEPPIMRSSENQRSIHASGEVQRSIHASGEVILPPADLASISLHFKSRQLLNESEFPDLSFLLQDKSKDKGGRVDRQSLTSLGGYKRPTYDSPETSPIASKVISSLSPSLIRHGPLSSPYDTLMPISPYDTSPYDTIKGADQHGYQRTRGPVEVKSLFEIESRDRDREIDHHEAGSLSRRRHTFSPPASSIPIRSNALRLSNSSLGSVGRVMITSRSLNSMKSSQSGSSPRGYFASSLKGSNTGR